MTTTRTARTARSSRTIGVAGLGLALALAMTACGDDDDAADSTAAAPTATTADGTAGTEAPATTASAGTAAPATTGGGSTTPSSSGATTEAGGSIDPDRCAENEAASTITYVSSFDFAAAASILDVITAEDAGYFDEVCLDVEIVPGFAPSNGAVVASGDAQMSSAGSFGEIVNNNVQGEADLVAVAQYGKTAIEALVVPEGSPVDPEDLAGTLPGTVMGIKGDIPYSLQALLGIEGVERGGFEELLLEGFDPVAHLDLGIDALPVYKSNEPAQLDAAGVAYTLVDPLEFDVPASFGVFFTSRSFLDEHPTAVQDFVRAALRGFELAVEDPDTAIGYAFARIDAAGNPNFFSDSGEGFRWETESQLVIDTTPEGEGIGLLAVDRLADEIDVLTEAGVFTELPDFEAMYDTTVTEGLYDGTTLAWPG